jgi:hypothetical protein
MRAPAALKLALVVAVAAATPASVEAGELIRYRSPDGSVGFVGDTGSVPDGAVILTRRPSSNPSRNASAEAAVPPVTELLEQVRRRCQARWSRDRSMFDHCVSGHTREAVHYRNLLLDHPPGSKGRALIARCRRQLDSGDNPDFPRLVDCITKARSELLGRPGSDPASLSDVVERHPRSSGQQRARQAQQDRLRKLREEQARADEELERGRRKWGPRYRKAQRELDQAEDRTRSIVEQMRRRGCRTDTLACGGLGKKLTNARRVESEKRGYLTNGIVNECRAAGCQPGWLR